MIFIGTWFDIPMDVTANIHLSTSLWRAENTDFFIKFTLYDGNDGTILVQNQQLARDVQGTLCTHLPKGVSSIKIAYDNITVAMKEGDAGSAFVCIDAPAFWGDIRVPRLHTFRHWLKTNSITRHVI